MKRPLTGLVLCYALGIWAGAVGHGEIDVWLWVAIGCLAIFFLARQTRYSRWALGAALLAVGGLAYRQTTSGAAPDDIASQLGSHYQPAVVRGVIVSDARDRASFQLAVEELRRDEGWVTASGRLFVFLRDLPEEEEPATNADDRTRLRYGDRIECSLAVQPARPPRNPHVFDFAAWLRRQGIQLTGALGAHDHCAILERDAGQPLRALSLRCRERFREALVAGLEDEPRLAGVLGGMVIGERAEIPPDTYTAFQQAGAFHVFAISGLHVGLLTTVLVIALRLLHVPRRWCGLIVIPLLVLYVFATGARPGALRALAMACVFLGGWILVRPIDLLNALAVAAVVILVIAPAQLFDGGFILSFVVVLALLALTPPIETWLRQWVALDPLLPEELVPHWRQQLDRATVWLVRLVSASVAAWIGLLPLMAIYFNLFTPVSVLANIVAVPLLGAIIALGLVSMIAHPFWAGLAVIFNNANFFLLHSLLGAVDTLGRLTHGHWYVQAPPVWIALVYYAAVGVWLADRLPRVYRCAFAAAGMLVAAGGLVVTARQQAPVEITVLDLHRGAALFVNVPGEHADVLIDAGDPFGGARTVKPFLRGEGVDRLGAVWFTRGTKAHVAGFGELVEEIPVREVIHSGVKTRSRYYKELLGIIADHALPLRAAKAGAAWPVGEVLPVQVLHPPADWEAEKSEDNSLVVLLEHGGTRVLVLGDAGETVEQELVRRYPDLRAEIVVKGRHGSESSGTRAFLETVRPRVVILATSVQFGQRSQPDLRERLAKLGIELYRTDEAGAVRIGLTASGYSIEPWF
jgi:competence protein ComEC